MEDELQWENDFRKHPTPALTLYDSGYQAYVTSMQICQCLRPSRASLHFPCGSNIVIKYYRVDIVLFKMIIYGVDRI